MRRGGRVMRKEQWDDLTKMIDVEVRNLLAQELTLLLDNEVVKPEFHNVIVSRIKELKGE